MEIAATVKLRRKGDVWAVPSQNGKGTMYTVDLKGDVPTCSCPDHETRGVKCKHIYAVEFSVKRETRPDGTTTVTKTVRVTYGQNWPAYNAAQTHEKTRARRWDIAGTNGPPRIPLSASAAWATRDWITTHLLTAGSISF
jgi:hypothetical protein